MYLSHLMIDVGSNPDRPRPGRMWLRNIYHVHQRLCMAFPSAARKQSDPSFLQPFKEDDFPLLRKTIATNGESRHSFLFRVDNDADRNGPRAIILVQSNLRPDWEYAFQNAPLLAAPPETKVYDCAFRNGDRLRFRIRINLTQKAKNSRSGEDLRKYSERIDAHGRKKSQSKRIALILDKEHDPEQTVREWFALKAARSGFDIQHFRLLSLGWTVGHKPNAGTMRFRWALLEGSLSVSDAEVFSRAIASGIGSAKAFGLGLLSVRPE